MTERTCIICRSKADKRSLLRLVMIDGKLAVDEKFDMPGRGAYVHPRVECVSKMAQAARWERALKVSGEAFDRVGLIQVVESILARLRGNTGPERSIKPPRVGRVRL